MRASQISSCRPSRLLGSSVTHIWQKHKLGHCYQTGCANLESRIWPWLTSIPQRSVDFIIEFCLKYETDWLSWQTLGTGVFVPSSNNSTPIQSPRTPDGSPMSRHTTSSPEAQMETTLLIPHPCSSTPRLTGFPWIEVNFFSRTAAAIQMIFKRAHKFFIVWDPMWINSSFQSQGSTCFCDFFFHFV